MRTSRTIWLAALLGVALSSTAARAAGTDDENENLSADAEAENKNNRGDHAGKTLAERIPPVTRRVFVKKGRVELTPALGMSLDDPFHKDYVFQGGAAYHINEMFAVGVQGEYYASSKDAVDVSGGTGNSDFNHPKYAARLELIWSPIYGKLNLFAEEVFHFDTFVSAGAGYMGLDTDSTVAGTVAIGQHFFVSEWAAIRWDLRDQIFSMDVHPGGGPGKHLQNLLTFNLGFAFYLPTSSPSVQ
jgi:outer membrane beta-barrel protein